MPTLRTKIRRLEVLEFEFHLDFQEESSYYVAAIEWRMKIQIQQDKLHRKWTSIAHEFTVYSSS